MDIFGSQSLGLRVLVVGHEWTHVAFYRAPILEKISSNSVKPMVTIEQKVVCSTSCRSEEQTHTPKSKQSCPEAASLLNILQNSAWQ